MSHACSATTLTALRLSSQLSRSRTTPLLQLFSGFARCQGARTSTPFVGATHSQHRQWTQQVCRGISSTAQHRARQVSKNALARESVTSHSASKLEPAQTVASHTEGLLDSHLEEEDQRELTWRDYDPVGGMPLPGGELSQPEINAVFDGEGVEVDTGNYILNVMHWRRLSGALIDSGIRFPNDSGVTREQALQGLEYVRSLDPDFDEQAAGQRYVDDEAEKVREEMRARAVKLGIYKPEEEVVEEEEESQQGTEEGRARTGTSALLQLREANERQFEQEEAAKELAAYRSQQASLHSIRGPLELLGGIQPSISEDRQLAIAGAAGVKISRPQTDAWLQPVERKPWVKYYEDHATIIKEQAVPQLSTVRRLGPSLILLLFTLGGCYYLGVTYDPPPQSARLFPDTPPSLVTITTISALLATSFIAGRLPFLWRTYNKYFCITPGYPNTFSILGCSWRHDTLMHLLTNVGMLYGFGTLLHEDLGRGGFLAVYIASGAIGGFGALTYTVLCKQWTSFIYGASGNMLGIAATVCVLHPYGSVQVPGVGDIPMPGWALLTLLFAWVGGGALKGLQGIDHAGHIAGMTFGSVLGWTMRQRQAQSATEREAGQVAL